MQTEKKRFGVRARWVLPAYVSVLGLTTLAAGCGGDKPQGSVAPATAASPKPAVGGLPSGPLPPGHPPINGQGVVPATPSQKVLSALGASGDSSKTSTSLGSGDGNGSPAVAKLPWDHPQVGNAPVTGDAAAPAGPPRNSAQGLE